jgi:hypothetical protein
MGSHWFRSLIKFLSGRQENALIYAAKESNFEVQL